MPRLLFEKKDNAIWISHLDLMRVFQRAFKRAGLMLKHTQGFNPRPSVSIALPLSVGIDSSCELLDFDLVDDQITLDEILTRLNGFLVSGVHVLDVYETGRKIRDLSLLRCVVTLEYDDSVPSNAVETIKSLFSNESVIVPKKTKSGTQDQNIIPMIRSFTCDQTDTHEVQIQALICCQNPALNPMQLVQAIELYASHVKPDFCRCTRVEIYDSNEIIFR